MKQILLSSFLFCTGLLYGQVFETSVDVGFNLSNVSIIPGSYGSYIIGGGENDFNIGPEQIIKIDSAGNVVWARKYNNGFFDFAPLGSNRFIIYDMRDSSVWGTHQFGEISIFNSDGILQSAITIPETLVVSMVHPTADGGTIALGVPQPPNGNGQAMILKTDSMANFQWIKYIDDTLNTYRIGLSDIVEANAGGYIAIGTYQYPDTFAAPYYQMLIRLDAAGDTIWTKSLDVFWGAKIFNASENGFIVIAANCSPSPAIVLFDSTGNIKWTLAFDCSSWIRIDDFALGTDSSLVFCGSSRDDNGNGSACLIKIDTSGAILWMRTYPVPTNFNYSNAIMKSNDNGYALLAFAAWTNLFTVIKTDSNGVSSCDSLMASPVPVVTSWQTFPSYRSLHPIYNSNPPYQSTQFAILADSSFTQIDNCLLAGSGRVFWNDNMLGIFPNPTNDKFAVKSSGFGEQSVLEIFNTIGEKIFSTVFNFQPQTINLKLPPGIYFVRLSDSEKQLTKKLVIE